MNTNCKKVLLSGERVLLKAIIANLLYSTRVYDAVETVDKAR